jgi:ABC-type antimicrobial peptide transport system permease subunit
MEIEAVPWNIAVAQLADITKVMQNFLFFCVIFIYIIAGIVIINTLSMAVLERTAEISMMRAIGAQKNFILCLFVSEIMILSFFFGLLGIIAGILIIQSINIQNIGLGGDQFLSLLLGGDTFRPVIDLMTVLKGLLQLGIVICLSMVYPLFLIRKVTPLHAVVRKY